MIVLVVLLIVALASARERRPYQNAEPGPPVASVPLQFHFEDTGTTRPASCAVDGVGCAGL